MHLRKHIIGIEGVKFNKDHLCGACEARKMTRAKHPSKTIMTTSHPFELLHMDLFGPTHYSTLTTIACLYGFVIVDDYSRYTWVHIILYKTEVQDVFRRFANRAMTNYGVKIKHIRSDIGTEFEHWPRPLSAYYGHHSLVLCSVHTSAEWHHGAQEQNPY